MMRPRDGQGGSRVRTPDLGDREAEPGRKDRWAVSSSCPLSDFKPRQGPLTFTWLKLPVRGARTLLSVLRELRPHNAAPQVGAQTAGAAHSSGGRESEIRVLAGSGSAKSPFLTPGRPPTAESSTAPSSLQGTDPTWGPHSTISSKPAEGPTSYTIPVRVGLPHELSGGAYTRSPHRSSYADSGWLSQGPAMGWSAWENFPSLTRGICTLRTPWGEDVGRPQGVPDPSRRPARSSHIHREATLDN